MSRVVVSIGAGHGGHDIGFVTPGASGGVPSEKELNLALACMAAEQLRRTGRFEPVLVREDDRYVNTLARAETAARHGSRCHVEIHAAGPPGAGVWYSARRPQDGAAAQALAETVAQILHVPCTGAHARRDSDGRGRLSGFEDYYEILEALFCMCPVFYVECGLPFSVLTGGRLLRCRARQLARAIAQAAAQATGQAGPPRGGILSPFAWWWAPLRPARRPPVCLREPVSPDGETLWLSEGFFRVRTGPSRGFDASSVITGLVYTKNYTREGGWLHLSREGGSCITAAAQDAGPGPSRLADGVFHMETAGGAAGMARQNTGGYFFVRAAPSLYAGALGAIRESERFLTVQAAPCKAGRAAQSAGWRRIFYCDREGFVAPGAFLP